MGLAAVRMLLDSAQGQEGANGQQPNGAGP